MPYNQKNRNECGRVAQLGEHLLCKHAFIPHKSLNLRRVKSKNPLLIGLLIGLRVSNLGQICCLSRGGVEFDPPAPYPGASNSSKNARCERGSNLRSKDQLVFGWLITNLDAHPVGADSTESIFGPLLSCSLAILVLATKYHPLIHCWSWHP